MIAIVDDRLLPACPAVPTMTGRGAAGGSSETWRGRSIASRTVSPRAS